jgi:hypothetical protein
MVFDFLDGSGIKPQGFKGSYDLLDRETLLNRAFQAFLDSRI